MEKKELIVFTYSYPFGKGETFLKNELDVLCSYFSPIHLFPLHYGDGHIPRELPQNVTFSEPLIRFDIKKDKLEFFFRGIFVKAPLLFSLTEFFGKKAFLRTKWLTRWMAATFITRILLSGSKFKSIRDRIKSNTLIYFYWGDKSSGIVPFLKRVQNNPVVVRFHGSDLFEEINGGYMPYRGILVQHLDYAVFVSETGMKYLHSKYGSFRFSSAVYRLGVPGRIFKKGSLDDTFRIVSCSHVIPLKRVHFIQEALRHLPFKIIWTHFGDGPLFSEIQERIKSMPGSVKIILRGEVENKEIMDFYASNEADLFINVSLSEGIPVSIMEAFSFGIPALATDVGGTREIVDDNTGILIPADVSPEDIAKRLSAYYHLSEKMKQTFRENAFACWQTKFDAGQNFSNFSEFLASLQ